MTPLAAHRPFGLFLMAFDTLLVIGRLQADPLGIIRIKRCLMASRTPGCFQSGVLFWPIVMAFAAIVG